MRKVFWLLLVIAFPILEGLVLYGIFVYLLLNWSIPFGVLLLCLFVAGITPPIIVVLYIENKRATAYLRGKYEAKFSSGAVEEYLDLLEESKKEKESKKE